MYPHPISLSHSRWNDSKTFSSRSLLPVLGVHEGFAHLHSSLYCFHGTKRMPLDWCSKRITYETPRRHLHPCLPMHLNAITLRLWPPSCKRLPIAQAQTLRLPLLMCATWPFRRLRALTSSWRWCHPTTPQSSGPYSQESEISLPSVFLPGLFCLNGRRCGTLIPVNFLTRSS